MAEVSEALVLRGGRLVDATGERRADVLVRDGRIVEVGAGIDPGGARVFDVAGCVVAPGLVDLHAHLREPGFEEAETVETGARAAAVGGYTAVVAMPNTEPALDEPAQVLRVLGLGATAPCDVQVAAAITKGRRGEELAPLGELFDVGVRVFTDDGACVADAGLMRRALQYATALPGAVVAQHCEEPSLAAGGHMHEGEWSGRLGLAGVPAEAESIIVARDIALARCAGARVHFLHLSTAQAIELVGMARQVGVRVSCEVAPHHFTLTDEACAGYDPVFKVSPPLRPRADVDAVRAALADGTVDAIATDHAPHAAHRKDQPFEDAPPGMVGLETALSLTLTELVRPGVLDLGRALALLSWQPARIAGLTDHGGPIAPGRPAHLCVIDPEERWTVDPARTAGKSRNNPYAGRELVGRVRHTFLGGEPVVLDGEVQR